MRSTNRMSNCRLPFRGAPFFFCFCALTLLSTAIVLMPVEARSVDEKVPVLVELFTSEGCSSCPSADRLLSKLWREQPVEGAYIVPLSEHVDYWNYLGWKDPFSQASLSARQNNYVNRIKSSSVYTPQMVVDGRLAFVGSSESQALAAIKQAITAPAAGLAITNYKNVAGTLSFDLKLSSLPPDCIGRPLALCFALVDDTTRSQVTSGENNGSRLNHISVVRNLEVVKRIKPTSTETAAINCQTTHQLPQSQSAQHIIVFLQDEENGTIWGVVRQAAK